MQGRRALSNSARTTPAILPAHAGVDSIRVAAADLASLRGAPQAPAAILSWIANAFRPTAVEARVSVPDRTGRLRPAARSAAPRPRSSSSLRALRRLAFSSKRPLRVDLDSPPASALLLPLVARGEAVGVLDIVADRGEIESRWGILDCLGSLGAVAMEPGSRARDPGGEAGLPKGSDQGDAPSTPGAAWMAHEIRTPLLVARATVESVLTSELSPDSKKLLERSREHLNQLSETVDRILDWACGGLAAGRRPVDLVAVIREAVAAARAESIADRVHIAAPERLVITGDEARLTIAVTNLIRNAVKYSLEGSPVLVTLERSGGWASIRVDDAGPGVSEEERELIFAPLVRGKAGSGDNDGRGLGLFMARQAVEELGGRIWVESNGTGASFRIFIPCSR